ncbi:hypothetical protein GCM10009551_049330 [Nocardiopsis tropica]
MPDVGAGAPSGVLSERSSARESVSNPPPPTGAGLGTGVSAGRVTDRSSRAGTALAESADRVLVAPVNPVSRSNARQNDSRLTTFP